MSQGSFTSVSALRNVKSEISPNIMRRELSRSARSRRSSSCDVLSCRHATSSATRVASRCSAPLRQRSSFTCAAACAAVITGTPYAISVGSTMDSTATHGSSYEEALPWPRDFNTHYSMAEQLGTGSYGKVWVAVNRVTGMEYAVKVLPKRRRGCKPSEVLACIEREVEIWQNCQDSKFVCRLEAVYQDDDNVYLVQELCRGGDLEALLADGPLSEHQTAQIMSAVLNVLVECHSKGYVFGDIKTANFLLKERLQTQEQEESCHHDVEREECPAEGRLPALSVRLTDFGCAQREERGRLLHRRMGSPVYMAPELWSSQYGKEVDVWAAGVMMYQMLSGRYPFWDKPAREMDQSSIPAYQIMMAVSSNPIRMDSEPWQHISRPAQELIRRMLDRSSCTRIKASEALAHPWFQKTLGFTTRTSCPESSGQLCVSHPLHLDTVVSGELLRARSSNLNAMLFGNGTYYHGQGSSGVIDDNIASWFQGSEVEQPGYRRNLRASSCVQQTYSGSGSVETTGASLAAAL